MINDGAKKFFISRKLLHEIFDEVEDAVVILDGSNNLVYCNPYACEFFGHKFEERKNIFNLLKDLDTINFFNYVTKSNCNGEVIKYRTRYVKVIKKYIRTFLFLFVKDVTSSVQYKEFKTELVGNIAHELKTPLSLIMGYAETLLINENLSKERQKKFLEMIFESTNRLNALLKDIISLHSLENLDSGFAVEQAVPLKKIQENLKTVFEKSEKIINYQFENKAVFVKEEHLLSLLTNLIDNALKYSDGKNVYVYASKKENELILRVEDEGPAIPEEERERIFERFYTRSKSRNKQITGTGLGLSIVKHITTLYGGVIKLYTNKYHGNVFEIILREKG